MRICSECKKKMIDGYYTYDGLEYYCSDECLHKHYTEEEYLEMCDEDNIYWTAWEDEEDIVIDDDDEDIDLDFDDDEDIDLDFDDAYHDIMDDYEDMV